MRKLSLEEWMPIMLAFSGIIGIGPMVFFRLAEGNYLVAAIDAVAVIGLTAIAWAVYVRGAVRIASVCMALLSIITVVITIRIRGGDQLLWAYPGLVCLFYLLKPMEALLVSLITVLSILPVILASGNSNQIALFLGSLTVTVALSIAFAAMTAGQRRQLHLMTLLDPLTGVGNRRALDQKLEALIGQSQDLKRPFVLIMMDIDHFKSVNDLHGHAVGDTVLHAITDTLQVSIEPTDDVYRAGGEEFVILAGASGLDQARRLAEKLRIAVSEIDVDCPTSDTSLQVTASFGLAEFIRGENRDELYRRADDALYEAKRNGRNRLCLADKTVSLSGTASYKTLSAIIAGETEDAGPERQPTSQSG
ncbi:MAG: GGDEF domain-containing protein [Pseudomonadota bacterium]